MKWYVILFINNDGEPYDFQMFTDYDRAFRYVLSEEGMYTGEEFQRERDYLTRFNRLAVDEGTWFILDKYIPD